MGSWPDRVSALYEETLESSPSLLSLNPGKWRSPHPTPPPSSVRETRVIRVVQ